MGTTTPIGAKCGQSATRSDMGNTFIHDETLKVSTWQWTCIEQMIRMNDLGDTNGELALWIDGRPVSHLGKGFPRASDFR